MLQQLAAVAQTISSYFTLNELEKKIVVLGDKNLGWLLSSFEL